MAWSVEMHRRDFARLRIYSFMVLVYIYSSRCCVTFPCIVSFPFDKPTTYNSYPGRPMQYLQRYNKSIASPSKPSLQMPKSTHPASSLDSLSTPSTSTITNLPGYSSFHHPAHSTSFLNTRRFTDRCTIPNCGYDLYTHLIIYSRVNQSIT